MISNRIIMTQNGLVSATNVKSVIFDIATNWGGGDVGVRSIEFKNNSTLIALTTEFTAYATTDQGAQFVPAFAFNTAILKASSSSVNTEWNSASLSPPNVNQRLIIVFDSPQTFDEIVINNSHSEGAGTSDGARQVKITITDVPVTDTVYNSTVPRGLVLNDNEWPEHVASDVADDQTVWTQP